MNYTVQSEHVEHGSGTLPIIKWQPEHPVNDTAIVLLMEAYGLTDHIKTVGDRLAAEGYLVIAPDLYNRLQENLTVPYEQRDRAMTIMDSINIEDAVNDCMVAIAEAYKVDYIRKIIPMGLCFGGSLIIPLASVAGDKISAGISFYGHCDGQWLDWIGKSITSELLFFYGTDDAVFTSSEVDVMEQKLMDAGVKSRIIRFEGAGHAYFNPARSTYSEEASEETWKILMSFLRKFSSSQSSEIAAE